VPETNGRVAQVYIGVSDKVKQGAPIFRLDSSKQDADLEASRRKIAETDAAMTVAKTDIQAAEGKVQDAESSLQQARDELETKAELNKRNPGNVAFREIERLRLAVQAREGNVASAVAGKESAIARLSTLLPAEKASAEAALAQAQVALDKTLVRASFNGRIEQFTLRPGDIVNPFMRPAGVIIPDEAGRMGLQAGFGQVEAQVLKPGMFAEVTCISKPWTIIPMLVTATQDFIAAGQLRAGEQLIDAQQLAKGGSILVTLEPLYENGLDGVMPGSSCIANAYTSNHDLIASGQVGGLRKIGLHVVDAVGLVHAMILRLQALVLPIQTLVFGNH
jgi:multidrug resistance efflux pump